MVSRGALAGRASQAMLNRMQPRGPIFTILAAAAIAVSFGSTPARAAPGFTPINHQRVVPLGSAEVWSRLHEFLQDQGFAVTSENRPAGIIDAARATPGKSGFSGFAQCSGHLFWRTVQAKLELTILVKPVPDGTKVTVNAAFIDVGPAKKNALPSYACTSTGVLESAVLDVASGQPMEAAVIPR